MKTSPHASTAGPPILDGPSAWRCYLAFFRDQVGLLSDVHNRYGSMLVLRERLPWRKRVPQGVIVSGAEHNRQVLSDIDTYYSVGFSIRGPRGSAQNRLRKGLVGMNGEQHRQQRRLVSPLFAPRAGREYFQNTTQLVAQQLDSWPVGEPFDVADCISRMSLLISAQNLLTGDDLDEAARLAEMTADLLKQGFSPRVWLFPVNAPGTPFRRLLQGAEILERELLKVIDRCQPATQDSPHLFDRLIGAHVAEPDRLSREELVGQMVLLFGASHETTAKAVMWSIFLLAQHPYMLAELHTEIESCCGDEPPTIEDLERLPVLDAITKESMRILPPVPWIARRVKSPTELSGLPLAPRDYVIVSIYGSHRDEEVFPQANQFRPERWFEAAPDSFAYLPFSAGPRTCIAKSLGMMTVKLMIAMILQRFRLTLVPHCRIDRTAHVTLAPKYGLPMVAHHQDRRFTASPIRGNIHELVDLSRRDATIFPSTIRLPRRGTSVPAQRHAA